MYIKEIVSNLYNFDNLIFFFLLGAVPGFVKKDMKNALITGICLGLLYFIFSFITKKFYSLGFAPIVYSIIPLIFVIPWMVAGFVSGITKNSKVAAFGLLGAFVGFLIVFIITSIFTMSYDILFREFFRMSFRSFRILYSFISNILTALIIFPIIISFQALAYKKASNTSFRKFISFEGRINVIQFIKRYLLLITLNIISALLCFVPIFVFSTGDATILIIILMVLLFILSLAVCIATTIILAAQVVKRLHDSNTSGSYYFLVFVPFGNLYLWYLMFKKSTEGANDYGEIETH